MYLCVCVYVQEEPEDLSDSSHPAIVPLKDAPPITEVETHSPAPNYITVHYSRLSRYNPLGLSHLISSSHLFLSVSILPSLALLPSFSSHNTLFILYLYLHHLSPCRAVDNSSKAVKFILRLLSSYHLHPSSFFILLSSPSLESLSSLSSFHSLSFLCFLL